MFHRGDFIEDTMGHVLIQEVRDEGLPAWELYGTFLYYTYAFILIIIIIIFVIIL